MVEPIMFVGIGFLVAGLLVLGVLPLVHARAVRLTMRRLEALTPLSMAEIQADKDQLRAEFAMSTRRLEMSVEQLKAKTTNQLTEIGKKSEAIARLKLELGERNAQLMALEAKERQLDNDVQNSQSELSARINALSETERALAEAQAKLADVTSVFNEHSMTADSQRIDLVTMRAHTEVLKGQIESYEKETKELQERLTRKSAEADAAGQQLVEEQARAEKSRHPRRRSRPPVDRANYRSGNPRPPRPGADRAARRAGPLSRRQRIRLRPPAQRSDQRAEDRSPGAGRARRKRKPPPARYRGPARREGAGGGAIAPLRGGARQDAARDRRDEARGRERLGERAHGKRRVARAHQRRGRRGGAPDRDAGGARFADRRDRQHDAQLGVAANGSAEKAIPSIAPNGNAKGTLADRIRALQTRASARVQQAS